MLGIFCEGPLINFPKRATAGSACFDIEFNPAYSPEIMAWDNHNIQQKLVVNIGDKALIIPPRWRALLPTGIYMDIPEGHSVRIHPRSGISIKRGLTLINCEGVIDSDYVEEIKITAFNTTDTYVIVSIPERIAQGELIKDLETQRPIPLLEKPKQKTNRDGGFGSTGS